MSGNRGWVCPVCGRGNAPFNVDCACHREDKAKQPAQQGSALEDYKSAEVTRIVRENTRPTDCPRCWQHGFNRTHGLMEVCPYSGRV